MVQDLGPKTVTVEVERSTEEGPGVDQEVDLAEIGVAGSTESVEGLDPETGPGLRTESIDQEGETDPLKKKKVEPRVS